MKYIEIHSEGESDLSGSIVWTEKVYMRVYESGRQDRHFISVRYERNQDGSMERVWVRTIPGEFQDHPKLGLVP